MKNYFLSSLMLGALAFFPSQGFTIPNGHLKIKVNDIQWPDQPELNIDVWANITYSLPNYPVIGSKVSHSLKHHESKIILPFHGVTLNNKNLIVSDITMTVQYLSKKYPSKGKYINCQIVRKIDFKRNSEPPYYTSPIVVSFKHFSIKNCPHKNLSSAKAQP